MCQTSKSTLIIIKRAKNNPAHETVQKRLDMQLSNYKKSNSREASIPHKLQQWPMN